MESDNMDDPLIIIDTDCGTDDAMAIMLAVQHHASKVIGITCVFGNTEVDTVCQNVMRVLEVCGHKTIPIYRGVGCPLVPQPNKMDLVHGSDGFGECGHLFSTGGQTESPDSAITTLIALSRKFPGRITIVAMAPLTNIATAHRVDPGFTERLKDIVCLGGNYRGVGNTTETAEYNFYCDPEAAHIVLSEAHCPIRMIPWETVLDYGIEWHIFNNYLNGSCKKAQFLKKITAVLIDFCHRDGLEEFYDCDFLAVAAALYPKCVTKTLSVPMAVECHGTHTRGMGICLRIPKGGDSKKPMIEIVQEFDEALLNVLREDVYSG